MHFFRLEYLIIFVTTKCPMLHLHANFIEIEESKGRMEGSITDKRERWKKLF